MKQAFLHRKIASEECKTEVASLIGEARADIQADPILQRACAVDLLKWCNHLEQGNGRRKYSPVYRVNFVLNLDFIDFDVIFIFRY